MNKTIIFLLIILISCSQNNFDNVTSISFNKNKFPLVEKGIIFREKGEFDKAIEIFNYAEKKYGKMVTIYFNRGLTYKLINYSKEALINFNSAIIINKKEPKIFIERAKIYFTIKKIAKGCEDLQNANKIDINHNNEEEISILLIENCN